jgi:hypothetical protein
MSLDISLLYASALWAAADFIIDFPTVVITSV